LPAQAPESLFSDENEASSGDPTHVRVVQHPLHPLADQHDLSARRDLDEENRNGAPADAETPRQHPQYLPCSLDRYDATVARLRDRDAMLAPIVAAAICSRSRPA
jgi:hypothetical protein